MGVKNVRKEEQRKCPKCGAMATKNYQAILAERGYGATWFICSKCGNNFDYGSWS